MVRKWKRGVDTLFLTSTIEYGGAAIAWGKDAIYHSEFASQRLCKLENGQSIPLTVDSNQYRFADGVCVQDTLYSIREDHGPEGKATPQQVVNEIVSIDTTTGGEMKVVVSGKDFIAAPRVSPDGTQLAYVCWNHPHMPWDETEIRIVNLDSNSDPSTESHQRIPGPTDRSLLQPLWHPDGRLFYISDETGYYNIHHSGNSESILPMSTDFGGRAPGWILGQQGFRFLSDGRLVTSYTNDKGESVVVVLADDGSKVEYGMADGLPMTVDSVIPDENDATKLYFMGGSPSTPSGIYHWSMIDKEPATLIRSSSSLSIEDGYISIPTKMEFACPLGTAYGYYYAPCNKDYQAPSNELPPLLVKAHGGPTACTSASFNPSIQYWTSRGFAVLDVDYGGSTGYGRAYRQRLKGKWGIVDIDDVCAGAQALVDQGLVDPKRLAIDGGSAGGYTTLGALAFRKTFTAGCSLYGVASLEALASDTHKFESRYLDGLVGKYPEQKELYKERAPIEHVDQLDCPILLLQGDEDKIVPPNQAELMHEALLKKGIPTALKIYKGEQHGFRKAENIEDALDSELYFFSRVFGFDAPDIQPFAIDNMETTE